MNNHMDINVHAYSYKDKHVLLYESIIYFLKYSMSTTVTEYKPNYKHGLLYEWDFCYLNY